MSKIRGSLAYPLFVLAAGFGAVIFMLAYVMPKFSSFFLDLGQELPLLTRVLISSSQLAEKTWPISLIGGIFFYWSLNQSLKADGNNAGLAY